MTTTPAKLSELLCYGALGGLALYPALGVLRLASSRLTIRADAPLSSYTPSQADVQAFSTLTEAPSADKYPHSARWYRHIQSYANEHSSLPGDKSRAANYWASNSSASGSKAPAAAAAAADDDDIDLFGSDDEEVDEEAEKLKQQRLAEYAAKKANKPKTIAKVRLSVLKRANR